MSARTVYRDGSASVVLTGDLEGWVRRQFDQATAEAVAVAEAELGEVAARARAEWYGPKGVTRETGQSGDIQVVTTIDATRGEVRVAVGSVDGRKAGKSGKPVPAFVHRPARDSVVKKQVTNAEYWATPKARRANYHPMKGDTGSGPFIWVRNPAASDGKFLLAVLVKTPGRRKVKVIARTLAERIAKRIGGQA